MSERWKKACGRRWLRVSRDPNQLCSHETCLYGKFLRDRCKKTFMWKGRQVCRLNQVHWNWALRGFSRRLIVTLESGVVDATKSFNWLGSGWGTASWILTEFVMILVLYLYVDVIKVWTPWSNCCGDQSWDAMRIGFTVYFYRNPFERCWEILGIKHSSFTFMLILCHVDIIRYLYSITQV